MRRLLRATKNGVALAANQVGLSWRVFIVRPDFAAANDVPEIMINPRLIGVPTLTDRQLEGCLSFPDTFVEVDRMSCIHAGYFDTERKWFSKNLSDFAARVFQHECEHLDGEVFIKHIDRTPRWKIIEKMRKMKGI